MDRSLNVQAVAVESSRSFATINCPLHLNKTILSLVEPQFQDLRVVSSVVVQIIIFVWVLRSSVLQADSVSEKPTYIEMLLWSLYSISASAKRAESTNRPAFYCDK